MKSKLLYFILLLLSVTSLAGERQALWPKGKMPDAGEYPMPCLEWFEAPGQPVGTCMILISGGSYNRLADAALIELWREALTQRGVQCVELEYRTPRPEGLPYYQAAWEDGQRAVRLVRSQAAARGYDPERIGVVGMSAGGHLSLLLATSSSVRAYAPVDKLDSLSCHINWAVANAPAYVTTDADEKGTKATRQGYGPDVTLSMVFRFDDKTCPICLHHGGMDPYSPDGSILVYRQLRRMGIPSELHLYPNKKHGAYGFDRALEFMTQMGYLGPVAEEVALMDRYPNDDARASYLKQEIWPEGKMPDRQDEQCTPYLEWHFPAERRTDAIQIIYSGGSYKNNSPDSFEVAPARRYLNERGMTVVTVKYRVPRPAAPLSKHTTAWQDLQRAIRIVRSEAPRYGLDPGKIGIMGSSAGGHLTLMGVTSSLHQSYRPVDALDKLPCNVQWGIGIYPAYVLSDGMMQHNTTGGNADDVTLAPEFSFDLNTCPMLFIHGDADYWAAMNSVKTWEKMRSMGIQSELHTLALRPHCFQRTAFPGTGSYTWLDRIGEYLSTLIPVSAEQIVRSELIRCPDATYLDFREGQKRWNYASGLEMKAFLDYAEPACDTAVFRYVESWYDKMIDEDGQPYKYKLEQYNIDNICPGRTLIPLYLKTGKEKYLKAMQLLHSQLEQQPRTKEGGFWHKGIYPDQIWLDGLYMAEPFMVDYAAAFESDKQFRKACEESMKQFLTAAKVTYDPATGLLRHAYDSSRKMFWCDRKSGQSQHCWARALGWYCMAAVEVLEKVPEDIAGRQELVEELQRIVSLLPKYADKKSGMWYQVLDQPGRKGNYLEASASAMFTYTILKGVRIGVLDASLLEYGKTCWKNLLKTFVTVDSRWLVNLNQCCTVGGLGGKNKRRGDFDYYISEPVKSNDPKGIGPFIWAALEMERLETEARYARTYTVAQDGSGDFRTVQEAVNACPDYSHKVVTTIYVKAGTYREQVTIPHNKFRLHFIGEGAEKTVISWGKAARNNWTGTPDKIGTSGSASVYIHSSYVTFEDIGFENTAGEGKEIGQAVAVFTDGDFLYFKRCRFIGNQDTLYTYGRFGKEGGIKRNYYLDCYIEGTTDFIFGPSICWFEHCTIHSKKNSYVTAASTLPGQQWGYVFHRCTLTAAPGVDRCYLGRPWGAFAKTVFLECELGAHIVPEGWHNWNKPGKPNTEENCYYAEWGNTGPGADAAGRVPWSHRLSPEEAAKYSFANVMFQAQDGIVWDPENNF